MDGSFVLFYVSMDITVVYRVKFTLGNVFAEVNVTFTNVKGLCVIFVYARLDQGRLQGNDVKKSIPKELKKKIRNGKRDERNETTLNETKRNDVWKYDV